MKLQEVSEVSIGVLLNREDVTDGHIEYNVFNIKNYEENKEYEKFHTNKNLDEKLTKEGDILFRLVSPNKIIYISKKEENLLVPAQLCIIRVNKEKINPKFLKWYFENSPGKDRIMQELTGSSIQKISVTSLRNIELPKIKIEKQNIIKDFIELWGKEKQVLEQLIENKEQVYNSIIEEIIEEEENIGTTTG